VVTVRQSKTAEMEQLLTEFNLSERNTFPAAHILRPLFVHSVLLRT